MNEQPERATRGCVVAAFPAAGKTYAAERMPNTVDSDSSKFSWKWTSFETRERHPDWPANYVAHITAEVIAGRTVLVSTHAEVRSALADAGIPFGLVYPAPWAREEYRDRMYRRESPVWLIVKVIDELWDDALVGCAAQRGCVHVVLRSGEYLSDALKLATVPELVERSRALGPVMEAQGEQVARGLRDAADRMRDEGDR